MAHWNVGVLHKQGRVDVSLLFTEVLWQGRTEFPQRMTTAHQFSLQSTWTFILISAKVAQMHNIFF
jgi:hypothetical protein